MFSFKQIATENDSKFTVDSKSVQTPIFFREDASGFDSYLNIFLAKYGLLPDESSPLHSETPSLSSTEGWAYITIYNSTSCGTTSPDALGGIASGHCINKNSGESFYVDCTNNAVNIYSYSSTDCSSTYTVSTFDIGCTTGDLPDYDDFLVTGNLFGEIFICVDTFNDSIYE